MSYVKFELWQEEFNFYIRAFKEGDWIGETIASIPYESEDMADFKGKSGLAHVMVDALNSHANKNKQ